MSKKPSRKKSHQSRRTYSEELKQEAVQMMLDGRSAASVAKNLGLSSVTLLYGWKSKLLRESGPAATTLQQRVHQLEEQLRQVERERDVLKKALAIFSQKT